MSKKENYIQCVLSQVDHPSTYTVSWIPESGAIQGATMQIKAPTDSEWSTERWQVQEVSENTRDAKTVLEHFKIARKYRQHTDV